MANTTRPAGPTAYDQIETLPPRSTSSTRTRNAHTNSRLDATDASEHTALLGQSGASRDYRTEARRDRARLAGDAVGEEDALLERDDDGVLHRKRPWSLKIDLAVGTLLLLANGYFWLMSLIAIKSPFVQHTALPAHRGSMFVPVWVSFLSCTINTASLLSFLYPHESPHLSFYTSLISAFFAIVTLILTIAVTQLRVVEGPLTFILFALAIVSLLHSATSAALTDKYAPILDPPEELDPDAPEARGFWPKVKRGVRAGLGFLGISLPISLAHVAVLGAFILLFLDIVLRSVDASVEQPGQRWKVDPWLWQRKFFPELGRGLFQSHGREYRIHLSCRGLGLDDPPVLAASTSTSSHANSTAFGRTTVRRTILIESDQGIPGQVDADWVLRMLKDGDLNSGDVEIRACFWDRPGYGFSDGSPSASAPHLVSALTQALTVSGEMARLEPPPSVSSAEVDESTVPSPLARSGFVLVSRSRSTALTSLFAALHPRLIHSALYITPTSPSLLYQASAQTRFAAIPHFFTRTVPALWTEMGVKRLYWSVKGVPRRRRVLAREGERVSGLIERSAVLEHHERDRARESDGAKAWERRRGRYPNRPTVVLGKGEGKDEGRRFVEDVVGEGLREWDREWNDRPEKGKGKKGSTVERWGAGCGAGGAEEAKCREALRGLLSLD
ncbi:hypothetical protein JCM11251_004921 [Rhodosporidiobolus azoricus]